MIDALLGFLITMIPIPDAPPARKPPIERRNEMPKPAPERKP